MEGWKGTSLAVKKKKRAERVGWRLRWRNDAVGGEGAVKCHRSQRESAPRSFSSTLSFILGHSCHSLLSFSEEGMEYAVSIWRVR